jgi:hypothetical protein
MLTSPAAQVMREPQLHNTARERQSREGDKKTT